MLQRLLEINSLLAGSILYLLTIGIIFVGRRFFEGRFYNVAFSGYIGDAFLIVIILIAKEILERDAAFSFSLNWHKYAIVASILFGFLVNWFLPGKQIMDMYHNLVVIPLLLYLVFIVSSYTIFWYGSTMQKISAVLCVCIWLALAAYDWTSGRIDQRTWLGPDYFR